MSTSQMPLREMLRRYVPRKPDPNLKRDLEYGWMIPYLLGMDELADGRWDYWCRTMQNGALLDEPIPQVEWYNEGLAAGSPARQHIEECLDLVANTGRGGWLGWSSWANLDYFLAWLLFGFGCSTQKGLPTEPTPGASMRLYQHFNLGWVMAYPYDHFGDIMAECKMGRAAGFFPSAHSICDLMVRMMYCPDSGKDYRREKVMEPCVGTGRMLLAASNYSMCLYGQDISATCVNATLVNAYFYAP